MVKFGLTKKEEKLFERANCLMFKSYELQRKFYDSIQKRFEKEGYNANEILEILTSSDSYVFSESGCSGEFDYAGYETIWDYIKDKCKIKKIR